MKVTVEKPTREQLEELGVPYWPVWTKEPSTFPWSYDEREVCFIVEGEVTVSTAEGSVRFQKGDLVTFERGLECTWTVHRAVKKHYQFG